MDSVLPCQEDEIILTSPTEIQVSPSPTSWRADQRKENLCKFVFDCIQSLTYLENAIIFSCQNLEIPL